MFGGFFGVTATWIYSNKSNCKDNPNNKASYGSATLSFLGTFFMCFFLCHLIKLIMFINLQ